MADKPMTKTELVAALAGAAQLEKAAVGRVLDALAQIVTDTVEKGGAVTVPGIGKVVCRDRAARTVRVPGTDRTVEKPADRAVKVVIAKALKDAVNG